MTGINDTDIVILMRRCLSIQDISNWSADELFSICESSIKHGWLNLARSSLALLYITLQDEAECENMTEKLCQMHNADLDSTEHLVKDIWNRTLSDYNIDEFNNLIHALLVHDQVNLGYVLAFGSDMADERIKLNCMIACGLWSDVLSILDIIPPHEDKQNNDRMHIDQMLALASDIYPTPQRVLGDTPVDKLLNDIPPEMIYFSAFLMPRQAMIPLNAYEFKTQTLKYSHPAMDVPSLLWEKNLPEASQFLTSINTAIELLEISDFNLSTDSLGWSSWPGNVDHPKIIFSRLGLANLIDSIFVDHAYNHNMRSSRLITDYSPLMLVNQILNIATDSDIDTNSSAMLSLSMFATDTAYLFKFTENTIVFDISSYNLLNLSAALAIPAPVYYIIIDFPATILKLLVESSYSAVYPQPLPFIFDQDVLLDVCMAWEHFNQLAKQKLPPERLVVLNRKSLMPSVTSDGNEQQSLPIKDRNHQTIIELLVNTKRLNGINNLVALYQ